MDDSAEFRQFLRDKEAQQQRQKPKTMVTIFRRSRTGEGRWTPFLACSEYEAQKFLIKSASDKNFEFRRSDGLT